MRLTAQRSFRLDCRAVYPQQAVHLVKASPDKLHLSSLLGVVLEADVVEAVLGAVAARTTPPR
jgi:hypothetical protein